MHSHTNPWADFRQQALFLVWGPPSHGPRSQVFAKELNIEGPHFIYSTMKRGLLYAPFKYSYQAAQTLVVLFRRRPKLVFVQSPPSLAVLFVYIYCALTNSRYLIDAHSAAFLFPFWTRPQWLHRYLARQAVTTIVTNEYFQQMVNQGGGQAFILHDIPSTFPRADAYPLLGDFNVVVINSFAPDEPLSEVLEAAASLPEIHFYVTGRKQRANPELLTGIPANVHFTDFLPNPVYYALLASAQSILCLTTRNHTMQRGACEALWLGKPIVTSDWPLLREYFHQGTVHVANTSSAIRQGVQAIQAHYPRYLTEIQALQIARRQEWREKIEALTELIYQTLQ